MAEIIPLDPAIRDKWLSSWIEYDPFCDEAVRDLQKALPVQHCMAVVTLTRAGQPFSLVFRAQKTVSSAGKRLKTAVEKQRGRAALSARFHNQPIDLDPLSDQLIISAQGKSPCSFAEALTIAESIIRWWPCALIYTFDGTEYGRA